MLPRVAVRIQQLARRPLQPVTIQHLLARNAAVSDDEHVQHARWCREEMPVRLAHRLMDFSMLPFVVVCNTRIHEVFRLFLHAFDSLVDFEEIDSLDAASRFAKTLRALVRGHDQMVHMMQEGHGELRSLLGDMVDLDAFLNQTFYTRIGNRVLAEHFLTVHEARVQGDLSATGVVQPACSPAEMTRELAASLGNLCSDIYGVAPTLSLEGELDTTLSFIPEHLNFVLQEVLKNAFRATVENNLSAGRPLPPVSVDIMKGDFDVTLKVSDCGGGMRREKLEKIWRYGYTSVSDAGGTGDEPLSNLCGQDSQTRRQIAGYGFGLPLSRVYARYFGGDIHVESMDGYGTDVYLNFNHLGDMHGESGAAQRSRIVAN